MSRTARLALVLAVGGLLAGCGAATTTSSGPTGLSQQACVLYEVQPPSPDPRCTYIDPQAGMSANNAYKQYQPVAPAAKPAATAVAAQVPAVLARVKAAPPITENSVRSALAQAFPYDQLEVSAHAAIGDGIGFGLEVGGACVHGWVSANDQAVVVDGFNKDGGCLPLLGH
jgi:hypothetical protein